MIRKKLLFLGFIFMSLFIFSRIVVAQEPEQESEFDKLVQQAQEKLKDLGYDPGEIDGVLGVKTEEALKKYQRLNGIAKTGQLDKRTKQKLGIADIEDQEVFMIQKIEKEKPKKKKEEPSKKK